METIKINRGNREVDEFQLVGHFPMLDKIQDIYLTMHPDINGLMRMLKTVFSQVILCPDNGAFRCIATYPVEGGHLGMFFPMILPETESHRQKTITVGVLGNVLESDKIWLCQEVYVVFNECCLP